MLSVVVAASSNISAFCTKDTWHSGTTGAPRSRLERTFLLQGQQDLLWGTIGKTFAISSFVMKPVCNEERWMIPSASLNAIAVLRPMNTMPHVCRRRTSLSVLRCFIVCSCFPRISLVFFDSIWQEAPRCLYILCHCLLPVGSHCGQHHHNDHHNDQWGSGVSSPWKATWIPKPPESTPVDGWGIASWSINNVAEWRIATRTETQRHPKRHLINRHWVVFDSRWCAVCRQVLLSRRLHLFWGWFIRSASLMACQVAISLLQVNENYKQCMPTKKGGPHFVYKPSAELQRLSFEYRIFQIVSGISLPNLLNVAMLAATRQCNIRKASDAPLFTFYVYRAESDDNVPWIKSRHSGNAPWNWDTGHV